MGSQQSLDESPGSTRSLAAARERNYDKGRSFVVQVLWVLVSNLLFTRMWCPNRLRCKILRAFGGTVGRDVWIRRNVEIQWPWNLSIGDNSWIGVGVEIIDPVPVTIESDVCLSQHVLVCSGSHDHRAHDFPPLNRPVVVRSGVWICARATVLSGVTVGANSVVGATALVTRDVPPDTMVLAPAPVLAAQRRV
ncbi:colanic acid biosynthesis acetyltransferase [Skermania piniformis]|uniref:Colanic acid biosynthesis acetyltransferase n=1 Tax=Skermania pinensis TaxID=39122 RepID=A0ABX8SBH7_9ACTN|nr:colanic acid biosynthesis acetyltransferase [Skermania piniformis]QXQ15218.1 colanic acid biosynthesis acetyltransferase [Skermania piniformis]